MIHKHYIYNFFTFLVIFFSLLPYLKTSHLTSDIQLQGMLAIIIYFFIHIALSKSKFHMTRTSYIGIILFILFSIALLALEASILDYFRILFFIFSFFIFIKIYENSKYTMYIAVAITIIIYFLGAVIQIKFGLSSLDLFVSNLRSSSARGLTSFASEPSFFGLISLAQILILEVLHQKKFRFFQFLALINIVLSGSLFAILPALFILTLYLLRIKYSLIYIFFFMLVSVFIFIKISSIYPNSRAIQLFNMILSNPELIFNDVSVQNRLLRSFAPLYISYTNYFLPSSFVGIEEQLSNSLVYLNGTDDLEINRLSNIMTYLIYPFGFIGAFVLIYFIYKLYQRNIPLFFIISIIFFSLANITIITPYITMTIAFIFQRYKPHIAK